MPRPIEFNQLDSAELVRVIGKEKKFSSQYPKQTVTQPQFRSALKKWQSSQSVDVTPIVKESRINAVPLLASEITKLRSISESPTPTAEAIVNQKMDPNQVLNTLYSSLTALEFTKMESEFNSRMKTAKTPVARKGVQSEWNQVVKAAQLAHAAGGQKGLKEKDFHGFSQELLKNKSNFNSIVNIAKSGVAVGAASGQPLTGRTFATGGWVTQTGVFIDPGLIITTIPGLCDKPFSEGVFTKNFSRSFSLTVRLTVWCPTWTNPFRTCKKNFTIAGVSFSVGVQVGYRVTCCGATAWGQAHAQACGTIIGITVCAGCTATITGVAGIGRSGSGSNCTYGIGINAQLKCTFAGITVFQVQVPFGFNVNGPCPPARLCA